MKRFSLADAAGYIAPRYMETIKSTRVAGWQRKLSAYQDTRISEQKHNCIPSAQLGPLGRFS